MPLLTGPGCKPSVACPASPFPTATANCSCLLSTGGVNDLYFIPCNQELTEANIVNTAWWTALMDGGSGGASILGNIGIGLGSIAKKADKKERVSSCKIEQVVSTTWALKYQLKCFDKSVDKVTHEQINQLIGNSGNYLVIARMCDGDNTVLPIGVFALSDFNWTVPDNFEEVQVVELELSWFELGMPKTYDVTGLSAIVPKAA
jgi:hypothetical protein